MQANRAVALVGAVGMAVAWLGAAEPARADSHGSAPLMESYPIKGPYPELTLPSDPWHYETGYFFGLTRGLGDEQLSDVARGFAMVGTIPLDVATIVGAALAGLFG